MPIDFTCGQCQHTLRVPDDSAGKKARCPQCGLVQPIPAPTPRLPAQDFDLGQFGKPPSPASSPASPSSSSYPPSGTQHAPANEAPYESYPGQTPAYRPNPYQAPSQYGPAPGYYGPRPKTLEEVQSRVKPPAIALLVVAIMSTLLLLFALLAIGVHAANGGDAEEAIAASVFYGFVLVIQVVILVGAARMLVMKNYALVMTAVILSLVSGLCCQLLLPFGIWALVILVDNDTKAHFS